MKLGVKLQVAGENVLEGRFELCLFLLGLVRGEEVLEREAKKSAWKLLISLLLDCQ